MRPDTDTYFIQMASLAATRATCPRRQVGCVLVDENNYVLGTGRNGVPKGIPHCTDTPCGGQDASSGDALDACMSVHAEINAVLQCRSPQSIKTVYTTSSPCIHCLKVLMNTSARRIVFKEEYVDPRPKALWLSLNPKNSWVLYSEGG